MDALGHLKTILAHKRLVRKYCFKLGLYKQGLLHDVSKYSPIEIIQGFKYYEGTQSPNIRERIEKGYSEAWMHHKGRNKHHFEYWNDYSTEKGVGLVPIEMPINYFCELICDRISASKTYNKEKYDDSKPLEYFLNSRKHLVLHENTEKMILKVLTMLKDKGEEETFRYLRYLLKKDKKK